MKCLRCGRCCERTRMPLSTDDVERLARLGPKPNDFSYRRSGMAYLRNSGSRCVFLDHGMRCRVYRNRPLGCRLYPVVYDKLRGIVPDRVCPSWNTVTEYDLEKAGPRLLRLMKKIYGSRGRVP